MGCRPTAPSRTTQCTLPHPGMLSLPDRVRHLAHLLGNLEYETWISPRAAISQIPAGTGVLGRGLLFPS